MKKLTEKQRKINRKNSVKKYNNKRYKTKEYKKWLEEYKKSGKRSIVLKRYRQSEKNKIVQDRYFKKRFSTDLDFKIKIYIRNRIRRALKRKYTNNDIDLLIGCSVEKLIEHLEGKFLEGMNWDNYGKWHIDHIYPLSKINVNNKDEVLMVCNYKNLQPLWAIDNIIKSDKIDDNDDYIKATHYLDGGIDKDNPRCEITIKNYDK